MRLAGISWRDMKAGILWVDAVVLSFGGTGCLLYGQIQDLMI